MRPLVISVTQFSNTHQQELDMSWINASSFVKSVFAIFYYHGFEKKGGFLFSNTAFVAPSISHLFLSLLCKFFTSVSPMAKALRTFIITMKNRNVKVRRMSLARTSSALWCKVTSLLWIQGLIYLQEIAHVSQIAQAQLSSDVTTRKKMIKEKSHQNPLLY